MYFRLLMTIFNLWWGIKNIYRGIYIIAASIRSTYTRNTLINNTCAISIYCNIKSRNVLLRIWGGKMMLDLWYGDCDNRNKYNCNHVDYVILVPLTL